MRFAYLYYVYLLIPIQNLIIQEISGLHTARLCSLGTNYQNNLDSSHAWVLDSCLIPRNSQEFPLCSVRLPNKDTSLKYTLLHLKVGEVVIVLVRITLVHHVISSASIYLFFTLKMSKIFPAANDQIISRIFFINLAPKCAGF